MRGPPCHRAPRLRSARYFRTAVRCSRATAGWLPAAPSRLPTAPGRALVRRRAPSDQPPGPGPPPPARAPAGASSASRTRRPRPCTAAEHRGGTTGTRGHFSLPHRGRRDLEQADRFTRIRGHPVERPQRLEAGEETAERVLLGAQYPTPEKGRPEMLVREPSVDLVRGALPHRGQRPVRPVRDVLGDPRERGQRDDAALVRDPRGKCAGRGGKPAPAERSATRSTDRNCVRLSSRSTSSAAASTSSRASSKPCPRGRRSASSTRGRPRRRPISSNGRALRQQGGAGAGPELVDREPQLDRQQVDESREQDTVPFHEAQRDVRDATRPTGGSEAVAENELPDRPRPHPGVDRQPLGSGACVAVGARARPIARSAAARV